MELKEFLHYKLSEFMQFHTLTSSSRIFYPFLDKNFNDFKKFDQIPINLRNKYLLTAREYATCLSILFKNVKYKSIKKESLDLSKFSDWKKHSSNYTKPVEKLEKKLIELAPFIENFILHGSLATHDFEPGYSDLDCCIFLNSQTLIDPNKLLRVRKLISKLYKFIIAIDPCQHHGFPVYSAGELNDWNEYYLPRYVFQNAVSLTNESELKIAFSKTKTQLLMKNLNYFKEVCEGKKPLKNKYQWKLFLSKLMLLPVIYFQDQGNFYSKKEAIDKVKKSFPKESTCLMTASNLRKDWSEPKWVFFCAKVLHIFNNPILPFAPSYLERFNMISTNDQNKIKKQAFDLVNKLFNS